MFDGSLKSQEQIEPEPWTRAGKLLNKRMEARMWGIQITWKQKG
jgi:hypothetical protein